MNNDTISLTAASIGMLAAEQGFPLQTAETAPDRLSVDRDSPFFDPCYKRIGVRFNGEERRGDVQEYCMSEGWIVVRQRNAYGKFRITPDGKYMFEKKSGSVVAYFKDSRPTRQTAPAYVEPARDHEGHLSAAEAKRRRKAEKLARLAK